jgi:hypothetical protein
LRWTGSFDPVLLVEQNEFWRRRLLRGQRCLRLVVLVEVDGGKLEKGGSNTER